MENQTEFRVNIWCYSRFARWDHSPSDGLVSEGLEKFINVMRVLL